MLGTEIKLEQLVESLSKPLKAQLRGLGYSIPNKQVNEFIEANLNYPLKYTPGVLSYFLLFKKYIKDNCAVIDKVAIGQLVHFSKHKGQTEHDAIITGIFGKKVKLCLLTSPPALSLEGNNKKNQEVAISNSENNRTLFVDSSKLHSPRLMQATYIFDAHPIMNDAIINIPVNTTIWEISKR